MKETYTNIAGTPLNVSDFIIVYDEDQEQKHTFEVESSPIQIDQYTREVAVRVVESTNASYPKNHLTKLVMDSRTPVIGAVVRYADRVSTIDNVDLEKHAMSELYKWMSRKEENKHGVKFSSAMSYLMTIAVFEKAPANTKSYNASRRKLGMWLKHNSDQFISTGGVIKLNRQPRQMTSIPDSRLGGKSGRNRVDYQKLMHGIYLIVDSGVLGPVEWTNIPTQ